MQKNIDFHIINLRNLLAKIYGDDYANRSVIFYIFFIEFDGVQHFKFNEYFHKFFNNFDKGQKSDIFKTLEATKNGYKIIRIF